MAVWTIPQSSDSQNGPFDSRIYFANGNAIPLRNLVGSGSGDLAVVAGSGAAATVNATIVRLDSNKIPVDDRTITYDGQKPHYFDAYELGEQAAPTGAPVTVSRL